MGREFPSGRIVDYKSAGCGCCIERRTALKMVLGTVLGLNVPRTSAQNAEVSRIRPQPGDQLVFADEERKGKVISAADLQVGPQVYAFPIDPTSRVVRDGSRLNKILLIRSDPESLSEDTRRRAVDGVAAYSAICTHQGCEVASWDAQTKTLWCPCHDSKFDPREGARVVNGPAPKRLATLPLKVVDGVLTVAAGFSGSVGFQNR
jgi:rieske iron-sulfur protein